MSRSAAMYAGSPAPPGCWLTKSPAGYRCAGSYRVTHRWLAANPARAYPQYKSADAFVEAVYKDLSTKKPKKANASDEG